MVTFDVTNLYAPWIRKTAISFGIEKYQKTLHLIFNEKCITDGIELILNNNSFQSNNINNIQARGTAIGIKRASTYATLTLAYLEENLYEIIRKNTTI